MASEDINPLSNITTENEFEYNLVPLVQTSNLNRLSSLVKNYPIKMILTGSKGIGKSYSLINLKKLLEREGYRVCYSNTFRAVGDLVTGVDYRGGVYYRTYVLIDLPSITDGLQSFLLNLEYIIKKSPNLSIIISMGINSLTNSRLYTDSLDKFEIITLKQLSRDESDNLIKSRTNVNFDNGTLDLIYQYSRGVPRQIIINTKQLISYYGETITYKDAFSFFIDFFNTPKHKGKDFEKILNAVKLHGSQDIPQSKLLDIFGSLNLGIGRKRAIHILNELFLMGLISCNSGNKNNIKYWF